MKSNLSEIDVIQQCTNVITVSNCSNQKNSFTNMLKFIHILKETERLWTGKNRQKKNKQITLD